MSVVRCAWAGNDSLLGLGVIPAKPASPEEPKSSVSALAVTTGTPSPENESSESLLDESGADEVTPKSSLYVKYHDEEWGVEVRDDRKQFEFLILEGAQAGLSWLTILKRREGYRRVFKNFDPARVAAFSESDIQNALLDPGIIRNRLKVRAAVKNAQVFLQIQEEFGDFTSYIWSFVNNKQIVNNWVDESEIPASSSESDRLSKDLKSRGMSFVGSTIMYAHMQATGLVNDHVVGCFKRAGGPK